jgi:hypothetical protein
MKTEKYYIWSKQGHALVMVNDLEWLYRNPEFDSKADKIYELGSEVKIEMVVKEKPSYVPTYSPTYPGPDVLQQPFKCSRCGLRLDQVMGYVCNDSQCPTFVRVTSAVYSEKHQWQTMNDEDK